MRGQAVARLVRTAFLAAIIAAIPRSRVYGQPNAPAPADSTPAPTRAPVPAPPSPANGGVEAPSLPAAPPSAQAPATAVPAPVPFFPPARRVEVSAEASPRRLVASLSHDLQFGLALLLGDGYRGIFPYVKNVDCGDAKSLEAPVCTNRAPVFLDVQPSFGLSDRWDFLVDLRFGLTRDFNTYRQFFVMPGFRYWLDPQRQVKFFTTIQLAYDRSNQNNLPGAPHHISNNDLGFRNSNGLMVEVMRNLGVYFQFGETIGFYRWLSFAVDAGIGVQARVP